MKKLLLAAMIGMGIMATGCGHNVDTPHLVQLDNGQYTMSTGDDYGIVYLKGYSDDQVTNYKIIRIIGKDFNGKTADDYVKYVNTRTLVAIANVQYIGEAVEYNGNVYQAVPASTHVYEGQKIVVNSKYKDNQKITINGQFKEWALAEVTKVERDEVGHLTHYTVKIVKDLKVAKTNGIDHVEIND